MHGITFWENLFSKEPAMDWKVIELQDLIFLPVGTIELKLQILKVWKEDPALSELHLLPFEICSVLLFGQVGLPGRI